MTGAGRVPGRVTIAPAAVQKVAAAIAASAAGVLPTEGQATLRDDAGVLAVAVTVPVALGAGARDDLPTRAERVRERVREELGVSAGRRVGAVDVRFRGVRRLEERRVR